VADYLDRLARVAARTRFAELSQETVAAAKDVILDTLGAILAGSRLPENVRLARVVAERSGPRTATLLGHAERAEPMLAALTNATAGVALEVDEGNRWGGGHPAIHVLPAALAVGEERRADGRRLIESLVAGYEVTSRLGGATTVRPNVHSHGTWGTVGAAVAVARLFDRDAAALRQVINLADTLLRRRHDPEPLSRSRRSAGHSRGPPPRLRLRRALRRPGRRLRHHPRRALRIAARVG
jgi:2-methylcitrate dehydratase PrpD